MLDRAAADGNDGIHPRLVAVSGNTRRPSRCRTLTNAITARIAELVRVEIRIIELVDLGPGFAASFERAELPPRLLSAIEAVETADVLVAVSPVYNGSYTGLFKHFLDFVGSGTLVGKPVVIGATGGGPRHTLVVEHQLRPLFAFFNALTIPTAVYAEDASFTSSTLTDPVVMRRVEMAAAQVAAILTATGIRSTLAG